MAALVLIAGTFASCWPDELSDRLAGHFPRDVFIAPPRTPSGDPFLAKATLLLRRMKHIAAAGDGTVVVACSSDDTRPVPDVSRGLLNGLAAALIAKLDIRPPRAVGVVHVQGNMYECFERILCHPAWRGVTMHEFNAAHAAVDACPWPETMPPATVAASPHAIDTPAILDSICARIARVVYALKGV